MAVAGSGILIQETGLDAAGEQMVGYSCSDVHGFTDGSACETVWPSKTIDVAVLFVDVSGSTQLYDMLGDEFAKRIIDKFINLMTSGAQNQVFLDGALNNLSRIRLASDDTTLRLQGDTTIENASGGVLNVVSDGTLMIGSDDGGVELNGAASLLADEIHIGGHQRDTYRFGGLIATPIGDSPARILSSVESSIQGVSGLASALHLNAETVELGNVANDVVILTGGTDASNAIRIGSLDDTGFAVPDVSVVIAGNVAIDTTLNDTGGDDLQIVSAGLISAIDDGVHNLTINTGVGDVTLGDVGGPQLLSNLSVATTGDIEAASLALSVNTIDLSSSAGNVLVTGDVSDIMGDVRINATLGDVTLSGSEAAQGAVELSAGGLVSLLGSNVEAISGHASIEGGGTTEESGVTSVFSTSAGQGLLFGAAGSVNVTQIDAASDISLVSCR